LIMSEQIARQIVLGQRPKGIVHSLKVAMPDGTEGLLPVTFRYRDRVEFGAFLDGLFAVEPPAFDPPQVSRPLSSSAAWCRSTGSTSMAAYLNGGWMHRSPWTTASSWQANCQQRPRP
jgi:hypothetical protein